MRPAGNRIAKKRHVLIFRNIQRTGAALVEVYKSKRRQRWKNKNSLFQKMK